MKTCERSSGLGIVMLALVLAVPAFGAMEDETGDAPPPDIASFLLPDGRVDLEALRGSGYEGPVNFDGYRLAPAGKPEIPEAKLPGDENWVMTFPDPSPPGYASAAVVWNHELVMAVYGVLYRWTGTDWVILSAQCNGWITALAVHDGDLIIGGGFTIAGGIVANRIAGYDGQDWYAIGFGLNGQVDALATYDGDLIAAGEFTVAGSGYANRIAAWNGADWSPLGDGFNEDAWSLAVYDGLLYAAGEFTSAGPTIANHIAVWNGASWSAPGNGTDGTVYDLVVHGGRLIAAGYFLFADSVPSPGAAAWDGMTWSALGGGIAGQVESLASVAGALYAGMGYSYGQSIIYRWDDPVWTSIAELDDDGEVTSLLDFEGQLMASIYDWEIDESIWLWDGAGWRALVGEGFTDGIRAMTMFGDDLIIAGDFSHAGDIDADGIVRWDGTNWYPLGSGINDMDEDDRIYALAVHGGHLYAGGHFEEIGGVAACNIARWDGASWSALGSGLEGDSSYNVVRALVSIDGQLVAGGYFDYSGPDFMESLAAWNGSSWTDLDAGYWADVRALAEFGGDLIVGGYDIDNMHYVARLDETGWHALGGGLGGYVESMTVFGGDLIVGGSFEDAGGEDAEGLAAWNGASWSSLVSESSDAYGGSASFHCMAAYAGQLVVGGAFNMLDGTSVQNIAAWNGSTWSGLGSGVTNEYDGCYVRALAVMDDVLAVGGEFGWAGGQVSRNMAVYSVEATPVSDDVAGRPAYRLEQNHPNPFNPVTRIAFTVPDGGGAVDLGIYDLKGRRVRTLVSGVLAGGRHETVWEGLDASGRRAGSGVYFCRLTAPGVAETTKLTLVE